MGQWSMTICSYYCFKYVYSELSIIINHTYVKPSSQTQMLTQFIVNLGKCCCSDDIGDWVGFTGGPTLPTLKIHGVRREGLPGDLLHLF